MSRHRGAAALVLGLAAFAATISPSLAIASDGYYLTGVHDLRGDVWHADDRFEIRWDPNTDPSAVVYWAIRGPQGEPLPGYGLTPIEYGAAGVEVSVPRAPGAYLFEARNVRDGEEGPPTFVPLYFDDTAPAAVGVEAPRWVAPAGAIHLRFAFPATPWPPSGILGYAVSIDDEPTGHPCASTVRCIGPEADLAGGLYDDTIDLVAPAEGLYYAHYSSVSTSGVPSSPLTTPIGVDGTPPQVHLDGVPSGWARGPVKLTATAVDPLSGMAASGTEGPVTAIAVDEGAPLLAPGPTATATVTGQGTHRILFWARDAVGNSNDGSTPFAHPAAASVRIDETDPAVHFEAPDAGDPERIAAAVTDQLAGPDPTRGSIALRPAGTGGPFAPLPTAVERGRLVARWNSDDFPHGPYEFRAVGFDAAGNSTASVAAADGSPFVLHDPVKREARLAFGFGGRRLVFQRCSRADGRRRCHRAVVRSFADRPASRSFPCCHGAVVGGRLLDAAGEPLAGQPVDVVETFARGARRRARATTVTSDAQGDFRARLVPGPSRRVSAAFAGTGLLTRAAGRVLRLRVRAGVRLRISSARVRVGGAPVVFSGQVLHPEARIPATGLPVELEFRLPGMAWSEFRTLETDSDGRFAYPYSFSDDDSNGVRFLFRAFVPATGNWAFAPATSRPLAVTG